LLHKARSISPELKNGTKHKKLIEDQAIFCKQNRPLCNICMREGVTEKQKEVLTKVAMNFGLWQNEQLA